MSALCHKHTFPHSLDHLINPGEQFQDTLRRRLASLRIGRIFARQHRSLSMAKGTVKGFNPTKGYGFIQPAGGGGKGVLFYKTSLEKDGLTHLQEGET